MNHLSTICSFALVAAAIQPLSAQDPDPVKAPAAKVFAERQDSSVKLTVTRKVKGQDKNFEVSAVSLDGKGLLVTSLKSVEASGRGGGMHVQIGGQGGGGEGAGGASGELTRVALLRADATEAEADLVLTDPALDLAFIRVRPGDGGAVLVPPAPPVAKTAPTLLQDVMVIERQGPSFQRIATAALLQIAAVIETPRRLYIPSQGFPGGMAIYNLAGELLGVVATVRNQSVIVPAEAILKLAASVPAKASE